MASSGPGPQTPNPAFTAVAAHYDRLMRDVPYESWVDHIREILEIHGMGPRRILDLACGTGSVSEILAREGFEVVGVDLSEPMIARARRKAAKASLPIRYYVQNAAALDLPEAPFDLCVSLFDSLNYIVEPVALGGAIKRVFCHLRPGGLFLFDMNAPLALEHGFFDQSNLESNDRLRYVWRSWFEPESRLCTVDMRFFVRGRKGADREFRETHLQRAYTEEEIETMLKSAGFDGIRCYHGYTLAPVRATTDRFFFVARRP